MYEIMALKLKLGEGIFDENVIVTKVVVLLNLTRAGKIPYN